ncbi:MAG: hypothetical protein H0U74_11155 [Bradymonadaceae bacterium]|nr:hypothetical protein [Lujinxingiaceae bacterium]
MRMTLRAATTTVSLMLGALFAPAMASEPEDVLKAARERFTGTFGAKQEQAAMERHIEQAIVAATASASIFVRPTARSKLRDLTRPCASFTFGFDAHNSTIQCEQRPANTAPLDGRAVQRLGSGGELHDLSQAIERRRITQTMRSKNGMRRDVYELDAPGTTMRVHTTITSKWLDDPVRYTLSFAR